MSGVRGVQWDRDRGVWLARAKLNQKVHNLGSYRSVEEAEAVVVAFRRAHMPFSVMDK